MPRIQRRVALVVAAQQPDRPPELAHAAPPHVFGRSQRLLGRSRVAAKDMPRARVVVWM
jgi:hypothetical protein